MLLGGCGPIAILRRTLVVTEDAVRVWVLSIDDGNGVFLTQAYSGAGSGSVYGGWSPLDGSIATAWVPEIYSVRRASNMFSPI